MRKMRKTLSFILVLALVVGSFSMVFAADEETTTTAAPASGSTTATLSDIAGLLGEEQIEVCQNLGIITGNPDSTYQPDKAVNRAEFATIITKALGIPASALAGYTSTAFKDTVGYGWAIPYLGYCQSKGIMIGDGLGNAMPGRTISVNEAITMICRALGYVDTAAELVGKWPSNFVTLGQGLSLYDDLSDDVTMNKENAAIAVYNALTVQLVAVDNEAKTEKRWKENPTSSFVGDPLTLLNSGLGCTSEMDAVLGRDYTFGDSLINIVDKIGAFGIAYVNKDGELVAFKAETTFISGTIDDEKFEVGDKKYSFNDTDANDVWADADGAFVNTDFVTTLGAFSMATTSALHTADMMTSIGAIADGDQITLACKVSGSTIKDIKSIVVWKATDADLADAADVTGIEDDQELWGMEFALDDDEAIDAKGFALVGATDIDAIAEDNVVYIYADSEDVIRKVAVGTEVVEGVIDEFNDDDFSIDGKVYEYSNDFLRIDAGADVTDVETEIDVEAVVSLDAYGYAFDVDTSGGELGTFGVVLGGDDQSALDKARLRLYSSDDSDTTFTLVRDDKINVYPWNDTKVAQSMSQSILNAKVSDTGSYMPVAATTKPGMLLGYRLNSAGEITHITEGFVGTVSVNSKSVGKITSAGNTTTYAIAANAVVMSYMDDDETDIAVSAIANVDFDKAKLGTTGAVVFNKAGTKIVAILLPDSIADSEADDVYGVLNKVSTIKDAERINALVDGTAVALDTNDTGVAPTLGNAVSLYKMTKNGAGKVKEAVVFAVNATDAVAGAMVIDKGVDTSAGTIKTDNGKIISTEDDVVVYKAVVKASSVEYTKSSLGNVKAGYLVWAYDTKDSKDFDGVATVVIWVEGSLTVTPAAPAAAVAAAVTGGVGTKTITITLTSGTFADAVAVQNTANWTYAGANAAGNAIASIVRVSSTVVTFTLTNNIAVGNVYTLLPSQVALDAATTLPPAAVNVAVPVAAVGAATATNGGMEFTVTLTAGKFAAATAVQNTTNWAYAGTEAAGNAILSIVRVSDTVVKITVTSAIGAANNFTLNPAQAALDATTTAPLASAMTVSII